MTEPQKIRRRVEDYAAAISAKTIDRVMSFFAPDLVSFDLEPALRYSRAENKRRRWLEGFDAYGSIAYSIRELAITTDGAVAFLYALNHFEGVRTDGLTTDIWVRWTACLRRIHGTWLAVHDHVPVPANLGNSHAALNLSP